MLGISTLAMKLILLIQGKAVSVGGLWVTRPTRNYSYLGDATDFKSTYNSQLKGYFKNHWVAEIVDQNSNPNLRTYYLFEITFGLELYLAIVKDPCYSNVITWFRSCPDNLEMERGRYCRPKIPSEERLCHVVL